MASPSAARLAFIQEADLPAVCQFLHENLCRRFTAQAWRDSLLQNWAAERPNFGTQLLHDGKVVGVFCAIYSDQVIDGRPERFCNPHSWVVLQSYRNQSIGLLLRLLGQRQYHFTMFTPNPKVAQVFQGLHFRVLDDTLLFIPNLPRLAFGTIAETDLARIGTVLGSSPARHDFERHAHLPWLRFVAFGRPGDMCLVVYKAMRWKRLPCAAVGHVSDAAAFERHRGALHNYLLGRGFAFLRVEARFLRRAPALAIRSRRGMPKLVLSRTLSDAQVSDLYSELMALDL